MSTTVEPGAPAVADRVAIEALWGGVRIVVIDTETTRGPDNGPLRVVSLATVNCSNGLVLAKSERFINPGVPVDRESRDIHGITDEHLAHQPMFADVADELVGQLTERDGERLVFAAHNVGFDVSVLRHELQLLGRDLPEIATIDTMGKLAPLVGAGPAGQNLNDLARSLGINNPRPHGALDDATTCAHVLVELLERAACQGHTDFDALLAELSAATTLTVRANRRPAAGGDSTAVVLPPDHVASHALPLSSRAGVRKLAEWRDQVAECATLRCRHLDARVNQAQPAPTLLLEQLEAVLDDRCAAGDTPGAATVLGALLPQLEHLPPRKGRLGFRNAALFWARLWAPKLTPLGRCDGKDLCPACRRREPCPLDMWPDTVAANALGEPTRYARGFFETTGVERGTGAYTSWLTAGHDQRICDAALWLCVEYWRAVGQDGRGGHVIEYGWDAGSRHPDIADAYAGQLAAAGRISDLEAGLAICTIALATRNESSHPGWNRLRSRRDLLAGLAQRRAFRPSGQFDEHGNPIPLRRHHPDQPRRTHPSRFQRTIASNTPAAT